MSDKEVLIQVENLEKSFGDHQVIKGISTTISRGDVVAVIGPSGCGKSTFLRSMNCLEEPTAGRITFEGTDITDEDNSPAKCSGTEKVIAGVASGRITSAYSRSSGTESLMVACLN